MYADVGPVRDTHQLRGVALHVGGISNDYTIGAGWNTGNVVGIVEPRQLHCVALESAIHRKGAKGARSSACISGKIKLHEILLQPQNPEVAYSSYPLGSGRPAA